MNPLASDLDHILDHTRDLWDEIRGERIFITGGTGFFGCWLLESFLWANKHLKLGAQATVLTRHPGAFNVKAPHLAQAEEVTLLRCDVRDFAPEWGRISHTRAVPALGYRESLAGLAQAIEEIVVLLQEIECDWS